MGRVAVRGAIVAYLESANLPFVGTVFPTRPQIINEDDYELSLAGAVQQYVVSEGGTAGVLIVNLTSTRRTRHALTGETFVSDFTVHEIELELVMANTAGSAVTCQEDHDTTADALIAKIRSDPNMGAPSVIWAAGEFSAGISLQQSAPFTGPNGSTVFIISVIHHQAWEDIEAAAGT